MSAESWTQVQSVMRARALLWHPGGLDDWSLSDWAVALTGEWLELQAVGTFGKTHEQEAEAADILAYAMVFASVVGLDLGRHMDEVEVRHVPFGGGKGLGQMRDAFDDLLSMVKEHNRNRDGAVGKGFTSEQITDSIRESLIGIVDGLRLWCCWAVIDLMKATVAKFDAVSERSGFPSFADFAGGEQTP